LLVSRLLVRASIFVICGILFCLCAERTYAEPAPRLPDARIFFDARRPFARPMVHVNAFGHVRTMLLDTGSNSHVMGRMSGALPAGWTGEDEAFGLDCTGRPVSGQRMPSPDVRLPGWPPLDELWVSAWADNLYRAGTRRPGAPFFDGVLSPFLLAGTDRVVVLDFASGTLSSLGSWDEAATRLMTADLALTPSALPIAADGHLVAPVVVAGRTLLMALDTGAPTSALYVPRGTDLADDQTRSSARTMEVRAGDLTASVAFTLIETLGPMDARFGTESTSVQQTGGLIGMDVLRTCIMALDRQYFAVRCLSNETTRREARPPSSHPPLATRADLLAVRASKRRHDEQVQVGGDDLDLRPRADGGYEWTGAHTAVRTRKDGRMAFSGLPAEPAVYHAQMDADDERRWFEDHVSGLLVSLARAHEREVIEEALEALPRHLSAILGDRRLSLAERRRILFLLWDEMAEPEDSERGWAGARARQLIELFVQDRLPPGAPGAYSAAELAAFNRTRRNGVQFAPYTAPERDSQRDTGDDR
jgi:hypothetical protein